MDTKHLTKFAGLGIFSPRVVRGRQVPNQLKKLYRIMLTKGFRETKWQVIYKGQLGGLVLPCGNGECELHVRFFKDAVLAEYEIGRSYLAHFWGPRFQAPALLYKKIESGLSEKESMELRKLLDLNTLGNRETDCTTEDDLFSLVSSKQLKMPFGRSLLKTNWRAALGSLSSVFSAALVFCFGYEWLLVGIVAMFVSVLFPPSRGWP